MGGQTDRLFENRRALLLEKIVTPKNLLDMDWNNQLSESQQNYD